ncbi:sensor histidine kinase [Larkinella soli]|uniref:sensor histidine kinase n=1 Tax=Larkinella soli TaxID=1770527 RepID=UPI000FFCBD65|nr:sensor histidine kinase [Larkinella soli]
MRSRITVIAVHLGFCLAFLALPYIFAPAGFPGLAGLTRNPHERTNLLSYLMMIGFFYLNYYVLIPKLYFRKRYVAFVSVTVLCFLIIMGMVVVLDRQDLLSPGRIPGLPPRARAGKPPFGFELSHALFLFLVGIFVSLSLQISNRLKETERSRLNTELSYLKAQINPHFLFNSLNSIYSLALDKSDRAPDAIVKLSSLMRYVIRDADQEQVPLGKELEYIQNYIDLQKLRLDDTVLVDLQTECRPNGKRIAPLILISFIENAFKFGVNPEEKSMIRIAVSCDDVALRLLVYNKKVRNPGNTDAGGIGIENTRSRLQLLYPDRHRLSLSEGPDDFSVELELTLA